MLDKRKKNSESAFKEACKKNGLIYKKHDKGTESDHIRLVNEDGKYFKLKNDLTIKKCCIEEDNDLVATMETTFAAKASKKDNRKHNSSIIKKKSSYKIQKGLQKA